MAWRPALTMADTAGAIESGSKSTVQTTLHEWVPVGTI